MNVPSHLVTAPWLAAHLHDPGVIVADVRWYLTVKDGRTEYGKGHLPGAVFVDLDGELAAHPGPGRPGRHPLPDAATFSRMLARIGAGPDSIIVAYDDAGGGIAARLWWLLRHFGHGGGRILDGGLKAWTAAGQPLETVERPRPAAPPMSLTPRPGMVIDKAEAVRLSRDPGAVLIDARAAERYEGDVEPVDARPGHIPGARNVPYLRNLVAPGAAFLPVDRLRATYAAAGVEDSKKLVAYCGSGVTACHDIFALSLTGRDDVLLYEGSWSEWAADPSLPAATGEG